jgi:hypothetical protein
MNLTFNLGKDSRVADAMTIKRVKSPMQVMKQKKVSIANDPLHRTLLFNNTYLLKSLAWMNNKTMPIHRNKTVNVKTARLNEMRRTILRVHKVKVHATNCEKISPSMSPKDQRLVSKKQLDGSLALIIEATTGV